MRLTDERIAELTRIAETHARVEYSSKDSVLPLLVEIEERRAADLTADDLKWLGYAKTMLAESVRGCMQHPDYVRQAIDAITRLARAGRSK